MIRLAPTDSIVVALLLVASVLPAGAECAWVLWAEVRETGLRGWWNGPQWVPVSGFESRQACQQYTAIHVRGTDKQGKLIMEKDPLEGQRGLGTKWRCLPDTVDPRGLKR